MEITRKLLAQSIDSTILKPNTSNFDIEKLCLDAYNYRFASVCILPYYVNYASKLLDGSEVKICSVAGFPLGGNLICTKLEEIESLLENFCNEIDMVINIGALMNNNFDYVREEIEAIAELCHSGGAIIKVIIETCLLNQKQKIDMCKIVSDSGADFIKTSTGFSTSGATIEDILLFKENLSENVKIKASGGIKNLKSALDFINAGASRIGTSSGSIIMEEYNNL
jgi:deoxyribose-phosphate aldolase